MLATAHYEQIVNEKKDLGSLLDAKKNFLIVKNNLGEEKVIFFENPKVESINSIEAELNDFYKSIKFKSDSKVSLNDGIKALEVAEEIMRQL